MSKRNNIQGDLSKIIILVSACLTGKKVRYDGQDEYKPFISRLDRNRYQIVSVCPEIEAGLGCPRPPVQLVENQSAIQCLQVDNHKINVTDKLTCASTEILTKHSNLTACILKGKSPSCGLKSTKLFDMDNNILHTHASGIFAKMVSRQTNMHCVDELELETFEQRASFLLHAHFIAKINKPDEIFEMFRHEKTSELFRPEKIYNVLEQILVVTLQEDVRIRLFKDCAEVKWLEAIEKTPDIYRNNNNLEYWLAAFMNAR